jgi:hypothetical protein
MNCATIWHGGEIATRLFEVGWCLLDGLNFCRMVYDLFDQISEGPEGSAKLRLAPQR